MINHLLNQLSAQGGRLWVNEDQLCIRAPKGILTPELQQMLRLHKAEIIEVLHQRQRTGKKFGIDLEAEAILDPEIAPTRFSQSSTFANAFLTGATGFLGAFLLHDLLQRTTANVYCLIRESKQSAESRLRQNLESYNLWKADFASRIIPVIGDLSAPHFGLTEGQFQHLAEQIDRIYHSAAYLNWVYPYRALKAANVFGTQEVLRLACQGQPKPVHYVSTVAVFESPNYANRTIQETDRPAHSDSIYLGYSQSKWVAEKLVLEASDRGLPVSIYRAPLIAGDSRTGHWNLDDFTCRMVKGCIQMGAFPDLDYWLELSPVNYVSQSIVHLSQRSTSGKIFHLNNPQRLHLSQLADWLNLSGYPVKLISYSDWQMQLKAMSTAQASVTEQNPLSPLLSFFVKKFSEQQLSLPELYQQAYKPQLDCQQTRAALAEASIVCPRINDQLLTTYFSFFDRSNFLPSPKQKSLVIEQSSSRET